MRRSKKVRNYRGVTETRHRAKIRHACHGRNFISMSVIASSYPEWNVRIISSELPPKTSDVLSEKISHDC
ncbi:hypothetical protein MES4922_410028 [Mesorhizobium ventifaucium]|uniref:Uncharacterized protein n=1 Tax=Mesorhizobium ventifaucium TaxID=666020 RepID=A0ABM9E9P7_9HYPH|nr:hypothetical protein MES4922_410028 [Mesorhizobium ventifaucium]